MSQSQLYRVLLIVLALVFLCVSVFIIFALAAHADCTVATCVPCLSLAKIQEILRQFGGLSPALAGGLALLALLQFAVGERLRTEQLSNLVSLKTRLNN